MVKVSWSYFLTNRKEYGYKLRMVPYASRNGIHELVGKLLDWNSDMDRLSKDDFTALMFTSENCHHDRRAWKQATKKIEHLKASLHKETKTAIFGEKVLIGNSTIKREITSYIYVLSFCAFFSVAVIDFLLQIAF